MIVLCIFGYWVSEADRGLCIWVCGSVHKNGAIANTLVSQNSKYRSYLYCPGIEIKKWGNKNA